MNIYSVDMNVVNFEIMVKESMWDVGMCMEAITCLVAKIIRTFLMCKGTLSSLVLL